MNLAKVNRRGIEYEGMYYCDRTLSLYSGEIFEIHRVKNYILIFDQKGALITKFLVRAKSEEDGEGMKYNVSLNDIKQGREIVGNCSYYEEIINEEREPLNIYELVLTRTKKNAGMVLAYIGVDHPAFNLVFKYFVNQNYPDLDRILTARH